MAEDVVAIIFADVFAMVSTPFQRPIANWGRRRGGCRGIRILCLMHELEVHPVSILAFIIELHAAGDVAGVWIRQALCPAELIIAGRETQQARMFMPRNRGTTPDPYHHHYQHQQGGSHGVAFVGRVRQDYARIRSLTIPDANY